MSATLIALLYLAAGILFILALRLSPQPRTARPGLACSIAGLVVAILATFGLAAPSTGSSWLLVIGGIAVGGTIGATIARRIRMSGVPHLIAALQALTGLAVVLVAAAVLQAPDAFGLGKTGAVSPDRLTGMAIAAVLGAIAFAGSATAFLRLGGFIGAAPYRLPGQAPILVTLGVLILVLGIAFIAGGRPVLFWLTALLALPVGGLVTASFGRDDMTAAQFVLNACCGLAIAATGFLLGNLILILAGGLIGASSLSLAVRMDREGNRPFVSLLFGGDTAGASPKGDEPGQAETGQAETGP